MKKGLLFFSTLSIALVLVFFGLSKVQAQTEVAGSCKVKLATFNPSGVHTAGWFEDGVGKSIRITIRTENCQGKNIEMSITEHDDYGGDDDIKDADLDNKLYPISTSNLLEINMLAGETECETTENPDCVYYLSFYSSTNGLEDPYDTQGIASGTLKYECDAFCDEDWSIQKIGQGTSGNKWYFFGVSFSDKKGPYNTELECNAARSAFQATNGTPAISLCTSEFTVEETPPAPDPVILDSMGTPIGFDGDYKLLEPIGTFTELKKGTSFGAYLNILIKIIIGLAAALAVVMIVIGGVQYMGSDAFSSKEAGKKRIWASIWGLVIALASYMLLNTINPDLLRLDLKLDKVTLDVPPNEISFTSGGGAEGGTVGTTINQNITAYDSLLKAGAQANGLECTWVKAFMYTESGGRPNAKSTFIDKDGKTGHAYGLMQLVPATFKAMTNLEATEANMFDPANSISAGTKYLGKLKQTACDGRPSNSVCNVTNSMYIAAAYNAGPLRNKESTSCPGQTQWQCIVNGRLAETRKYVQKIQTNYNQLVKKNWGC